MKRLNTISGLPRSGSTLLCNILNQNPLFHASSTSELPAFLSSITHQWTNSLDVKNELNQSREKTELKMKRTMRAYADAWLENTKEVVFDKSRGWTNNASLLSELYPDAKMIVLIRDLRNVFASIEKQHQKFPLLDTASTPEEKTIFKRADEMFSPQGMIGSCILGVEDCIRRKAKNVFYIQYESFVSKPIETLAQIYEQIDESVFEHDFNDVKNTATDPDGFYLHKFPHNGSGKVEPCNPNEWKSWLSEDLAETIMKRFDFYNQSFGYET